MTSISAALHNLGTALEALVSENQYFRQQLDGIAQRASIATGATVKRRGRPRGRMARSPAVAGAAGAPKKRGRTFKFTDLQAVEFRKQVEGGKSALGLAKELKISLPTMYNTLKRAGWSGRSAAGRSTAPKRNGSSAKRGRAFKFSDAQAAELRKQVDGGKSALALAQELKISLPTMYNTLKRAGWTGRGGRGTKAASTPSKTNGTPAKRGRAFKFSDDQAAGFRRRVESGEKARALAKELKISVPTMYNMLKRAGWKGRKGSS